MILSWNDVSNFVGRSVAVCFLECLEAETQSPSMVGCPKQVIQLNEFEWPPKIVSNTICTRSCLLIAVGVVRNVCFHIENPKSRLTLYLNFLAQQPWLNTHRASWPLGFVLRGVSFFEKNEAKAKYPQRKDLEFTTLR